MNDELYNEVFDRASKLFREYQSKPKGQMVSNMDNFDYWMTMVAFDIGYRDGYADGVTDITKEGREI
jgi:hypothetical protein